ncbi:MAG TPA: phospholipase, partial [Acidimicrobiia bacterium]|nr:phospholipase [Acidimicrobiia bacterium]
MLADLSRRGVDVRGLLWRSHSDRLSFSAKENRRLAREVSAAGGEVLLDERVRRGGSHHQKLIVLRHPRRPDDDVAFVGGIDVCHGRRDDASHSGDRQSVCLDPRYGPRPPWHDVQLEVRGPAVDGLDTTFRERWSDPTPLNHSSLGRAWFSRLAGRERRAKPLPDPLPPPPPAGTHAVQILRTYPARRPRYPFAATGERSVARAFAKAVGRARRLIYFEDQYFWSREVAEILAGALRRRPDLLLIGVLPRYPDKDRRFSGPPA